MAGRFGCMNRPISEIAFVNSFRQSRAHEMERKQKKKCAACPRRRSAGKRRAWPMEISPRRRSIIAFFDRREKERRAKNARNIERNYFVAHNFRVIEYACRRKLGSLRTERKKIIGSSEIRSAVRPLIEWTRASERERADRPIAASQMFNYTSPLIAPSVNQSESITSPGNK